MKNSAAEKDGGPISRRSKTLAMVVVALALAVILGLFGWYQFSRRAEGPIDVVKQHRIPGTDRTIGEGILDFIEGEGVELASNGFQPSWGAEETGEDVWVVSFVYEVGREANWVSWEVDMRNEEVKPEDRMARELWEGSVER